MCSKKFGRTMLDVTNVYVFVKRKRFLDGKETVERMKLRKAQTGLYNASIHSHIYKTLEYAEIAAATRVYDETSDKKVAWKEERGIIIYRNDNLTDFVLSDIIIQKDGEKKIDFHEGNKHIKRGNYAYTACGLVHSHPTAIPYIHANELSSPDYFLSLDGFGTRSNKKPITVYLVTNVGEKGTLIRFTPPTGKQNLKNAQKLFPSDDVADSMPRANTIKNINTIIEAGKLGGGRDGILEEKPIRNDENWRKLDPATVLWNSSNEKDIKVNDNINGKGQEYLIAVDKNCLLDAVRKDVFDLRKTTNVTVVERMEAVGIGMFAGFTNLKSVTIPSSVVFIGEQAFKGCTNLSNASELKRVKYIGYGAFEDTKLLKKQELIKLVNFLRNAKHIDIPNGVTNIADYAFNGYNKLESVTIPISVISIGKNAFYNCTNMTSVTIPNSVTSIGKNAFYECESLMSVTIPSSVTSIGDYAFYGCTNLQEVTFMRKKPPTVGSKTFGRYEKINMLLVPVGSINTYNQDIKTRFAKIAEHSKN